MRERKERKRIKEERSDREREKIDIKKDNGRKIKK